MSIRILPSLLAGLLLCTVCLPGQARAEATGILEVNTNAVGALVFVDDELVGEAPILEIVSVGRHTVRVERAGFAPFEQRITVKADTSVQLKANLLRLEPALEVRIDVEGAKVFLDNQQIGSGREVILDPAEVGLHELLVEHEVFGIWKGKVRLEAGSVTPVELKLRGSLGSVAIHSNPEGARISFDGQDYGPTPTTIDPVKAGNHGLQLTAPGRATVFHQVVVAPGKAVTIDIEMVEQGGVLLVRPSVKTAQVFVNGVLVGEGKQELKNVKAGKHSVRVAAAGYVDFLREVTVEVSGKTSLAARLEGFQYQKKAQTRLVGGPPVSGAAVVKKPAFWVAIGGGVGAAVGITIAAVLASQAEQDPGADPGVPAPATDLAFTLP
jgi:hypothetical protein